MDTTKDGPPASAPQQDNTGHGSETGGIMVVPPEERSEHEAPAEHEENEEIGTD